MISKKTSRKKSEKKEVRYVDALESSKKKSEAKNPPKLRVEPIPTEMRSL